MFFSLSVTKIFKFYRLRKTFSSGVLGVDSDLSEVFKLRYNVYCLEKKYLNSNHFLDGQETDEYDDKSIHFFVKATKVNKMVGYARLIPGSFYDILPLEKQFSAIKDQNYSRDSLYEVSRLIVDPGYRRNVLGGHFVLYLLMYRILEYGLSSRVDFLTAAIDNDVLKLLQRLGVPFTIVSESLHYMGSDSTFVLIDFRKEVRQNKLKYTFFVNILSKIIN